MKKVTVSAKIPQFPMATVLVGAHVNGKPNFITIAWFAMVNFKPPLVAVVMNKKHYTNKGIKENNTFSINFPSVEMVEATDYCSIISGYDADKSKLFDTFYGTLKSAPMIKQCPLTIECKLVETLTFATHEIFIGEIVEAYTEERYLTHEVPDIKKMNPIMYTAYDNHYWKLGEKIGRARHIGRRIKKN